MQGKQKFDTKRKNAADRAGRLRQRTGISVGAIALPVVRRGAAHDFLKRRTEIAAGAEPQPVGDLLDGGIGAGKQELGPLHLGKLDVVVQRNAGLLLELAGKIILGVAHAGGQLSDAQLIFHIQLDVIAAFLDGFGILGVDPAVVDTVDEIVVHDVAEGGQLRDILAGFRRLDVVVPKGVGLLRRKPALDGGPRTQRGEHDDGGLGLAQRVAGLHRHAVAETFRENDRV